VRSKTETLTAMLACCSHTLNGRMKNKFVSVFIVIHTKGRRIKQNQTFFVWENKRNNAKLPQDISQQFQVASLHW